MTNEWVLSFDLSIDSYGVCRELNGVEQGLYDCMETSMDSMESVGS